MPIVTVKDPATGQERRVYVPPQGMGEGQQQGQPQAQPQPKPQEGQRPSFGAGDLQGILPLNNILNQLQIGGGSVGAAIDKLRETGDLGAAFQAGQQRYIQELEKPGRGWQRFTANVGRNLAQEASDAVQETFFGQASTRENPDLPFLGIMPPLPRAQSSGPIEDTVTGLAGYALALVPAWKAAGLAGAALRALPGATKVGSAVGSAGAALKGSRAAQVASRIPGAKPVARAVLDNTVTQAAAAGAIADYFALDQHEGRLYDLLDQATQSLTGSPLEIPVLNYLRSDPNDVGAEGRIKNVLEGGPAGAGLQLTFRLFRALRPIARLRQLRQLGNNVPAEQIADAVREADTAISALSREQNRIANSVPDELADFARTQPGPLPSADPRVDPWTGSAPAPAAPAPAPRPVDPLPDMQPPRYSQVAEVSPQEIIADPQRFQFKEAGRLTQSGASGSLAEASGYNDVLGGVISVWRDPASGQTYVVNGHNRLRLARESGTDQVLVRYLQADTPEQARALGALQNIAEGQGTAVDAAKFMRDTGMSAADMAEQGINLSGPVARDAVPLSRLPQNLFDKVASGDLSMAKAVALGSEALDPQVINDVASQAIKRRWSADKITQAMQEAKFAQVETQGGGLLDMLGEEWAAKTSNFNQLLDVRTEAFRALREEMVALTSAARPGRQGILESAGNVIDVAGSQAARGQAAQSVEVFNRVTAYKGPVRDLLNEMAGQVGGKRTAKQVVTENLDRLRAAIGEEINGPRLPLEAPAPAAARPAADAPAAQRTAAQAADTKALMDRAMANVPPEKRAAVIKQLEARGLAAEGAESGAQQFRRLPVEAQRALAEEVLTDMRRVAGDDIAVRFNQMFEVRSRPLEHGGGGKQIRIAGSYDPIEDVVNLNGWAFATPRADKQQTAFHEAFHRLQFNYLRENELKALNSVWSQLKLAVGDGTTRRTLIEQQAVAFQKYAYARKQGLDPVAYLSGMRESTQRGFKFDGDDVKLLTGLEKVGRDTAITAVNILDGMMDFIEKAGNYFQGRGWTSIRSIFDQAYTGEIARRGALGNAYDAPGPRAEIINALRDRQTIQTFGRNNADRGVLFAEAGDEIPVRAPVPDEEWATRLARQIQDNRAAIEAGDMTLEDLLQNNVLKVQSPSGAKTYLPDAPPELLEAYRAHSDLVSRVDATGIPVMSDETIAFGTASWLERNNYSSKAVFKNLQQLSGPLSNYQENLQALRAAMLLADHSNYQAGIAANRWINAAADGTADLGQRAAELVQAAAMADRSNRSVESVTRPLGQLMRSTQIERPAAGSLPFDRAADAGDFNVSRKLQEVMGKEGQVPVSEGIGAKVSPDLEQAIRTGDFNNPKVAEELDALALNLSQAAATNGYSSGFWRNFNKASNIGARGLVMYRSSQLLSSGMTFWVNIINNAVRTMEMPLTQAAGALVTGHPVRAARSLLIYGQYAKNLMGSLRMSVESFKVGRGLFDLDRSQVDFLDRLAAMDAQGNALARPTGKGEWDLNTMPWVAIQDKSNWAIAQRKIWQTLNLPTRLQVTADSGFKSLVGQSFEYVRNIQPGLDNAVKLGMDGNSKEAWRFAQEYAQAAVDRSLRDVTIDGRTILDGVMDSPHAETAMRWATFTDDIWAEMQPRTTTYGMKMAEAKGLTGDAAQKFAQDYVEHGSKLFGLIPGDDIPWFARTFSLMPAIWDTGLKSPFAPLFSLIQPFNRTPGDIVKSVARKSPAAPLVDTWWRDVFSEDALTRDRAWGDIATGSAVLAATSMALTHGRFQLTGSGPIHPDAQRKWREMENKQPNSVRMRMGEDEDGNPIWSDWISMRSFQPFTSMIGALADYQEIANKVSVEARERLGAALVMDLVGSVAAGQLSQTYYTGFMELVDAAMGLGELDTVPGRRHSVARYFQRLIASLVPGSSAMRTGRRIEDPLAREVPASDNPSIAMAFWEETYNEIKNSIPGWSDELPPRRNWITGEPMVLSGVWGDEFLPPESPWLSTLLQASPTSSFAKRSDQADPVLREMGQLAGRGTGFVGPRPGDFTNGGQIKENRLNAQEYDDYLMAISRTRDEFGRTLHQALQEEINSDLYQENPQGEPMEQVISLRAAALNQVIAKFMKLGREAFLDSPSGKRLVDNTAWAEGANRDVRFRLKYGQEIDPQTFIEALR